MKLRLLDGAGYSPLAALVNAIGLSAIAVCVVARETGAQVPPWLGFAVFLLWIFGRQIANWYERRRDNGPE